jgi:hypothetical protein
VPPSCADRGSVAWSRSKPRRRPKRPQSLSAQPAQRATGATTCAGSPPSAVGRLPAVAAFIATGAPKGDADGDRFCVHGRRFSGEMGFNSDRVPARGEHSPCRRVPRARPRPAAHWGGGVVFETCAVTGSFRKSRTGRHRPGRHRPGGPGSPARMSYGAANRAELYGPGRNTDEDRRASALTLCENEACQCERVVLRELRLLSPP